MNIDQLAAAHAPPQIFSFKVCVKNRMGLHARPATHIVKLLFGKKAQVYFTYKKNRVDARSVLGLLLLGAPRNAKIQVEVSGADASVVTQLLQNAFESGLGDSDL